MYVCMYEYLHVGMCVVMHCMCVYMYVCMNIYVGMCVIMHVNMYVCIYYLLVDIAYCLNISSYCFNIFFYHILFNSSVDSLNYLSNFKNSFTLYFFVTRGRI